MAAQLEVQVEGLDELIRQTDKSLWEEPVRDVIAEATRIAERAAKERAPGTAAQSIMSETQSMMGRVHSSLPPPQAWSIESGRKPGSMPPIDVIQQWQAQKGVGGNPFVIARAIAARGIRGRFFMRHARGKVRNALPGLLAKAARQIGEKWSRQL